MNCLRRLQFTLMIAVAIFGSGLIANLAYAQTTSVSANGGFSTDASGNLILPSGHSMTIPAGYEVNAEGNLVQTDTTQNTSSSNTSDVNDSQNGDPGDTNYDNSDTADQTTNDGTTDNGGSGTSSGGGAGGSIGGSAAVGGAATGISCLGSLLIGGISSGVQSALSVPISNVTIEQSTMGVELKQCILDGIVKTMAQQVLRQMTLSVINWIKSGYKGNPTFVGNPSSFFGNIANQAVSNTINALSNSACSAFQGTLTSAFSANSVNLQPTLDLINSAGLGLSGNGSGNIYLPQCTLGNTISNQQGFLNGDFSQGGWSGWLALTTQDQNNPYGEYLNAEEALANQQSQEEGLAQMELNWGNGYLSITGSSGSVQTPGSLINQEASKTFGNDWDQLNLTKNFDDIFYAFVNTSINQLIGGGGLGGINTNSQTTNIDHLPTASLAVILPGSGAGSVISYPSGINCSSGTTADTQNTCGISFNSPTTMTLIAVPVSQYSTFSGWSGGGCSATTGPTCTVDVTGGQEVSATFTPISSEIIAEAVGSDGTIASAPSNASFQVNASASSEANPTIISGLVSGNYSVSATNPNNQIVTYGTCTFLTGSTPCTVTSFGLPNNASNSTSGLNNNTSSDSSNTASSTSIAITTSSGVTTKVVFKYQQVLSSNITVEAVGDDGQIISAPAGVTFQVNSSTPSESNPTSVDNLAPAGYIVSASNPQDQTVMAGSCTYMIGQQPCTVNSYGPTLSSSNGYSVAITATTVQGSITQVVFKY
jgi:hypothetical protein